MLTVLSAGLPISAKDILTNAMNEVFDNAVVIQELTKDNLRSRVRLSNKSVEVILVVLDGISEDMCKDIEGGLFKSEKYYNYTNDTELVNFLNNRYNLNIEISEVEENFDLGDNITNEVSNEEIDNYLDIIKSKDDTIRNLECRIKELTFLYGLADGEQNNGVNSELDELRDKNISLNNDILELKSLSDSKSEKIAELESISSSLKEDNINIENRLKKVSRNYDEVVLELNNLKVSYSQQSGIIRNKDIKISDLEKEKSKLLEVSNENKVLKETILGDKKILADRDTEISNLRIDIQSKDREVVRYLRELESLRGLKNVSEELQSANDTISSLKSELLNVSSDNDSLNKRIRENEKVINQLTNNYEELNSNYSSIKDEYSSLQEENEKLINRIKDDDESLSILNKEKFELQSKLSLVDKSSDIDSVYSLKEKIQDLQNKIEDMSNNIFTNIGLTSLPNGVTNVKVFNKDIIFNNVSFAFAGSAESRKGAYKCLFDEFKSHPDDRYLVVDLVSETSIDYVFQVKKTNSGLEWFRRGGSVQQYLSLTGLRNTKILSFGIGYINDSYFLSIDWDKRLFELENSGYKVIIFCGDISNIVGRVLHESFASHGKSTIYVVGNAVSSRILITNLRGISNGGSSLVAYYDFNPISKKFYEMISNERKILSTKGKR